MNRWLPVLALALAACTGTSTPYSFPGCDDAGSAFGQNVCSVAVFDCAQTAIAAQHQSCSADADCALVGSSSIDCISLCAASVRADQAGTFHDQIANEAQKFCAASKSSGNDTTCAVPSETCAEVGNGVFELAAFCDAGTCDMAPVPFDGGF